MAPEIVNNNHECGVYSDLWSLGCIIYDMLYNKPPFQDKTDYLVFENIINLNYSFPKTKLYYPEIKDLITNLLKIDPKRSILYQFNQK